MNQEEPELMENNIELFYKKTFNTSVKSVIESMDDSGDDIPTQKPICEIPIPQVGIERENIPLTLKSPFNKNKTIIIQCSLTVTCMVPSDARGIHTSRIGSAIAELTTKEHDNLQECAYNLACNISDLEYGGETRVSIEGTLTHLFEVIGWKDEKNKYSLEHYQVGECVEVCNKNIIYNSSSISLNHITACPCVQQTLKHAVLQSEYSIDNLPNKMPFITHSQRCNTTVMFENFEKNIQFIEILETIKSVIFCVQNTLPREYELALVYKSHSEPQFIEDVIRNLAKILCDSLADKMPNSILKIKSRSFESIHDYDLVANLTLPINNKF